MALRDAISGLRRIASGEAIQEAEGEFQAYLEGRLQGELSRHVKTGRALATTQATKGQGRIVVSMPGYLGHPGASDASKGGRKSRLWRFSWRKGTPKTALARGAEILRQAVLRRLPGGTSGR